MVCPPVRGDNPRALAASACLNDGCARAIGTKISFHLFALDIDFESSILVCQGSPD